MYSSNNTNLAASENVKKRIKFAMEFYWKHRHIFTWNREEPRTPWTKLMTRSVQSSQRVTKHSWIKLPPRWWVDCTPCIWHPKYKHRYASLSGANPNHLSLFSRPTDVCSETFRGDLVFKVDIPDKRYLNNPFSRAGNIKF